MFTLLTAVAGQIIKPDILYQCQFDNVDSRPVTSNGCPSQLVFGQDSLQVTTFLNMTAPANASNIRWFITEFSSGSRGNLVFQSPTSGSWTPPNGNPPLPSFSFKIEPSANGITPDKLNATVNGLPIRASMSFTIKAQNVTISESFTGPVFYVVSSTNTKQPFLGTPKPTIISLPASKSSSQALAPLGLLMLLL